MIDAVTQRPGVRLDLLERFVYMGEKAGVDVAERYFAAVEETCALLIAQTQSGAPYESAIEKLAGLRRVPVKSFGNYLLFYMPLHAARDIESILTGEVS